jgi:hypothetical protein
MGRGRGRGEERRELHKYLEDLLNIALRGEEWLRSEHLYRMFVKTHNNKVNDSM